VTLKTKTFTRYAFAFTAAISLVCAQASAQDEEAGTLDMTLEQAVSIGVTTNPEYGVVAASRRATDEELNQGEALFLPSLDLRADTGYEYTDNAATRAGTGSDTESKWRKLGSLTLTQLLFDGWESHFEVERQKARVRSAANRVRETSELTGLAIVEAYIEVLRQRELLKITRDNVAAHVDIVNQIEDGVKAGRSTQADLEQVRARIAQARATESSTRQSLRNAESRYLMEVGEMPGNLTLPVAPFDGLQETVDQEVEKALAYSPTLDVFEADIEAAYAVSRQAESDLYPSFDLELNATEGHDISGVDGRDRTATALVVMNWNLFRGGQKYANVREQVHRHQQAKEARAEAARSVENDVRQTWAGMIASGEQADQYASQAAANVEVVRAYKDQFDLNRRTLLDVLDAQNEWFVSRSNQINSQYVEMVGVYRLLALRGSLFPALGLSYPNEAEIAQDETWSPEETMDAR